jgi:hypothetical protein
MRLAPGFRVLFLCLALVGLLIGRNAPLPFAVDHGAMATAMMSSTAHDCCDASQPASQDNARHCDSATCPMAAPALLADKPLITTRPARQVFVLVTPDDLSGHQPPPLLEPPRA